MYTGILVCFFAVFLKNRNIISKTKKSKVTDYAALRNKYIVLPHPLFSTIIYSDAMKEMKMARIVANIQFCC